MFAKMRVASVVKLLATELKTLAGLFIAKSNSTVLSDEMWMIVTRRTLSLLAHMIATALTASGNVVVESPSACLRRWLELLNRT